MRYLDGVRFNYAPGAKTFDCKFIEPGIVSYRDVGGKVELLRKETLDQCMAGVIGNPVTIGHVFVTEENRDEVTNGTVSGWEFNADDGWFHVKGTADTTCAQAKMRANGKPSCGYRVTKLGPGGMYHGIRYDQEILGLEFNHLAIVDRPRYEDSEFRLNSIKSTQSSMNVFKFLKKLAVGAIGADGKPVEKETILSHEAPGDTEVEIDGKMVRLNELFDAYLKETAEAFTITPETALEVSGKVVTMGQLAEAHRNNQKRANALATETPEQKATREKKEADDKAAAAVRENEIAVEKKKKDDEAAALVEKERTNGTNAFFTLHTARATPKTDGGFSTTSGSLREKCERGAKKY